MGYILFGIFCLVFLIYGIFREDFFSNKNKLLIQEISELKNAICFDRIWCSISFFPFAYYSSYFIVYLIPNGIILMEDYSLDLNKDSKNHVDTYLFKKPKSKTEIDKSHFRKFGLIREISISDKGKLKMKVELYGHVASKSIKKSSLSSKMNFQLSLPLKKEELEKLLMDFGIIKT